MVKGSAPSSKKTHYRDIPGGLGHIPEESFKHSFEVRMPKTDGEDLRLQASTPGVEHVLKIDEEGKIHGPIDEALLQDTNYRFLEPEQHAGGTRAYQWSDAPDSTLGLTHGLGHTTRSYRPPLPKSHIDTNMTRFYNSAQSPSDSDRTLSSVDSSASNLSTPWSYFSQADIFNQDQGSLHMDVPVVSQARAINLSTTQCKSDENEHQITLRPQFTPQSPFPFLPTVEDNFNHQSMNAFSSISSGGQSLAQYAAGGTSSMADSSTSFIYGFPSTGNDYPISSDVYYQGSSTSLLYDPAVQHGVDFEHDYFNT